MTMDEPFEDALADLRISGSVLLHERYLRPWAIDIPSEVDLRKALGVEVRSRVIPFHLVRRGGFRLRHHGIPVVEVCDTEVAICASGAPHRMFEGSPRNAAPLERILKGLGLAPFPGDARESTELVCGVLVLRAAPLNPLLAALPPVLKVATSVPKVDPLLARATDMLALALERPSRSGDFISARLVEIFCSEAIRAYVAANRGTGSGWLRGLADSKIGKAIALVHARPGMPWSVSQLAGAVALSPSRFAARFRETVGQSVLGYVARWRMNIACKMLADGDQSIQAIASQVGYESIPAFARAFKSLVGATPGQWRALRKGTSHAWTED
jgi:AraC-like DNA-binding protein